MPKIQNNNVEVQSKSYHSK